MIAQSEGKINVFILCCKNTVNWKREIRPISSYAGHLFHHEKYTIAFKLYLYVYASKMLAGY